MTNDSANTATAATSIVTDPHLLDRVGMAPISRVATISGFGALWGFVFGSYLGGRQSGLQYLAENAHRLPRTKADWYFYHKTKNYRVMLGGIRRGVVYAGRASGLCLCYSGLEATLDYGRGFASPLHSTLAGLVTATTLATLGELNVYKCTRQIYHIHYCNVIYYYAIAKLPKQSFRYALRTGLLVGVTTGGLDVLHRYIKEKREQEQEQEQILATSESTTPIKL
jgi:hypothetical protein